MGGTNFNGLALVHELVRQGHEVTVLNRGRSTAEIPDSVSRLVADRSQPETVRAVLAGTEWDVIADITAQVSPRSNVAHTLLDVVTTWSHLL